MARHFQPQNQLNWNLLVLKGKNSSVRDDRNNVSCNLCLKSAILFWLIISCFFPVYSQAAGSFGTISGYGEIGKTGFASMEDAAAWGWANSMLSYLPNTYSEGGAVYWKPQGWPDASAPPAAGYTNYWWGYYYHPTPGVTYGPYPYYAIAYYPNVIPPAKNFGFTQNLCVGNPIHIGIGEKYQIEKDYAGKDNLNFIRYYHSSVFAPKGGSNSQFKTLLE